LAAVPPPDFNNLILDASIAKKTHHLGGLIIYRGSAPTSWCETICGIVSIRACVPKSWRTVKAVTLTIRTANKCMCVMFSIDSNALLNQATISIVVEKVIDFSISVQQFETELPKNAISNKSRRMVLLCSNSCASKTLYGSEQPS
jgi:hypothetical protein